MKRLDRSFEPLQDFALYQPFQSMSTQAILASIGFETDRILETFPRTFSLNPLSRIPAVYVYKALVFTNEPEAASNSFLILIMLRELRKIHRLAQESNMDWTLRRDMK